MSAAGELFFVDTNLLLYAQDPADPVKHQEAKRWLEFLWASGGARVSWQVLNEFYANAERKLKLSKTAARTAVDTYSEWRPIGFHLDLIARAWHWMDLASLSYWDCLIVSSAERLNCRWLLTEDRVREIVAEMIDAWQEEARPVLDGPSERMHEIMRSAAMSEGEG